MDFYDQAALCNSHIHDSSFTSASEMEKVNEGVSLPLDTKEPEAVLPEQVNYKNKPCDPYFASFFRLAHRILGFTFQGDSQFFNDPTISGQLVVKRAAAELSEEDSPEAYKQGVKDPKEINAKHKLKRVPLTVIERFPPCDIPGHMQVFIFVAVTIEAFLSALQYIPAFARDQQVLEMHMAYAFFMRYLGRSLVESNKPTECGVYPSSWSDACTKIGRNIISWADATFSKAHIETKFQRINTPSEELDPGLVTYIESLYGFNISKETLEIQRQTDSQTYLEKLAYSTRHALENINALIGIMKASDVPMFTQKYFHVPHPKELDLDTPLRIADAGARITMWMGGAQVAGYLYIMLFKEMRNIEWDLADRSIGLNQRTQLLEQISMIKEEDRSPYYKTLEYCAQGINKGLLDPEKDLQDIVAWDTIRIQTQLAFSALRYTEEEFQSILNKPNWFNILVSAAEEAHGKLREDVKISTDKKILRDRLRKKIENKTHN